MLNVEAIGVLSKDPTGSDTYTMWKIKSFGKDVTLFSQDSAMTARAEYRAGMRIRAEGRGGWNEFNDGYTLQISGCAIDGSDLEDRLRIKVDGTISHELNVERDSPDEGGGRYIRAEIEATVRGKDSTGEWADLLTYVRAHVIGAAVDKLAKLDKEGVTHLCFSGDLAAEPEFINNDIGYYAEITDVAPSQGRGAGNSDAFWGSKPRGLAGRKSAPVRAPAPAAKAPAGKKPGGGHAGPDDPLPF